MGISIPESGGAGSNRTSSVLSEINVTPLVDVMLVLLIIFMITSSVETIKAEQERERLKRQQEEETQKAAEPAKQQVPVDLPKVNSDAVNLSEQKKLVLTLDANLRFFLGETQIADCRQIAPELANPAGDHSVGTASAGPTEGEVPAGFRRCVQVVEEKLISNAKLRQDGELYLRASHGIDYGMVLMVMARVRKAGVTRFGLVAEPELEQ